MKKIIISNKKNKLIIKNTPNNFSDEFIIATIDLIKNGVLDDFDKSILAMLPILNDKNLQDLKKTMTNLLGSCE